MPSTSKQFLTLYPERVATIHDMFVNYGPHSPKTDDAWGDLYKLLETVTGMPYLQFERHKRKITLVYSEHLILQQRGVAIHKNPYAEERSQLWHALMNETVEVGS